MKRPKTNPFGWKYRVQDANDSTERAYFQYKSDAIGYARDVHLADGGEWFVFRVHRYGRSLKLVRVVGGFFDDWPGDDW